MITETTPQRVLDAFAKFDAEERSQPTWADWPNTPGHKFAIAHDGNLYPVKRIIELASVTPRTQFSGGDEANRFVRKLGFEVTSLDATADGFHAQELGIREYLQDIFEHYNDAPAGSPWGKNNPVWQSFEHLAQTFRDASPVQQRLSLKVDWSAGVGVKARIPWVAFLDSRETDTTRTGVYPVYLFREDMSGVYLALNQGITNPKGDINRTADEVRAFCQPLEVIRAQLNGAIDLRTKGQLGTKYQTATIAHKFYSATELPTDEVIERDLDGFLSAYDDYLAHRNETEQRSFWLFQANPKYFDLADEASQAKIDDESDWAAQQYRSEMHAGDGIVLWQAGSDGGVYALGELTSEPFLDENIQDWQRKRDGEDANPQWRVKYRYTAIPEAPVLREEIKRHDALRDLAVLRFPNATNFRVSDKEWAEFQRLLAEPAIWQAASTYVEPTFVEIVESIRKQGLRISEQTLRRYHLSLRTRRFVILSGLSGSGKTWLTRAYSDAVDAKYRLVAVAPNWTTNEDLLGYQSPLDGQYHHTDFSRFLIEAAEEYRRSERDGRTPWPYHLVLDEMNLAHVEYYFAKFLSAMELNAAGLSAEIRLGDSQTVHLPPNLYFIGTVNVDETTRAFADKVYDRAQMIELGASREELVAHIGDEAFAPVLLDIWDHTHGIAPFAFRVVDDIKRYIHAADSAHVPWKTALDEQILQKFLPKIKGADPRVGEALKWLDEYLAPDYPLSHAKAKTMSESFGKYGFASYF